jgi:DNA-binding response OmpR family regulator
MSDKMTTTLAKIAPQTASYEVGALAGGYSSKEPLATPKTQVLIVKESAKVSQLIKTYLKREGYAVTVAATAREMRAAVGRAPIDMMILDEALPDEDSWSALRWLRSRHPLPVIMLIDKTGPTHTAIEPDCGADDYVAKPFRLRELLARVRTIQGRLEKSKPPPAPVGTIAFPGWALDVVNQRLTSDIGREMHLTESEYRILKLLAENPRRAISRRELRDVSRSELLKAADPEWKPFDRGIDVHISNLRRKIDTNSSLPSLIRSVRGVGYRFVPECDSSEARRPQHRQ